ncbi:MAG: esterase/lipase family protein [Microbacterium sp.]|uniref:esterase/lipase family protein n=1 Tax=Microbacterium sp. TaxID=51671 RepID=UPI003F7F9ADC
MSDAPAARIPVLRRALWWAADYVYAARRQLAVLSLPWAIGRPRPAPDAWRRGDPDLPEVYLVPGVYEHWTFLRPLGDALAAAGHRVRVVHGLGVNRRSIADTADRLAKLLAETPAPSAGRVLVAHSKGGLIGKHLLVSSGAARRAAAEAADGGDPAAAAAAAPAPDRRRPLGVLGLVAVATPFGGSRLASLFVVPSIRAFRPKDETIVTLGRETSVNGRIVSIFGPYDPHIPEGSALDGATNVAVPAAGHFRVLDSAATRRAVLDGIALLAKDDASG